MRSASKHCNPASRRACVVVVVVTGGDEDDDHDGTKIVPLGKKKSRWIVAKLLLQKISRRPRATTVFSGA
jgi:hypothetical protein